jgi:hypothetical protein
MIIILQTLIKVKFLQSLFPTTFDADFAFENPVIPKAEPNFEKSFSASIPVSANVCTISRLLRAKFL